MIKRSLEYHLAEKIDEELKKPEANTDEVLLRLARETVIDELTGLYNRGGLEIAKKILGASLENHEIERVGIIFFDLDNFKIKQDQKGFGYQWGDQALKDWSVILQESSRNLEDVYRWGGDEFCLVIPNATDKILKDRVETIIKNKREHKVKFGNTETELHFSWGIGVARNRNEIESSFLEAEQKMKKEKDLRGRSR